MQRIDICRVLTGDMSPESFSRVYRGEISSYRASLVKGGASAPIILDGDQYIFVNRKNLKRTLKYFLTARLSKEEFGYLLDAMSLDEKTRFADNELRESVLDLSDSDLTKDDVDVFLKSALSKN
jgi:hypothetical protein